MARIQHFLRWFTLLLGLCLLAACRPGVAVDTTPESDGEATAEIEVLPFAGQYRVIVDVANLRAGPGVAFEEMGTLNEGDVVTLNGISAAGDWYRTTTGAWVAAGFVAPVADTPVATPTASSTPALEAADTPTATATPAPLATATPTPMVTPLPTTAGCPPPPSGWVSYTIQSGDTLSQLAVNTGSTVAELQEVNCLDGTLIITGQRLFVPRLPPTRTLIPADTPTPTNTPSGPIETETPTLEPADTLTPTTIPATPMPP